MKTKTYIRIGYLPSGKARLAATSKLSDEPLKDSFGYPLPTVGFAVEFVIPDAAFQRSQQLIASINIDQPIPLATVRQIEVPNG